MSEATENMSMCGKMPIIVLRCGDDDRFCCRQKPEREPVMKHLAQLYRVRYEITRPGSMLALQDHRLSCHDPVTLVKEIEAIWSIKIPMALAIFGHAGCGAYRLAFPTAGFTSAQERDRQEQDLRQSKMDLSRRMPLFHNPKRILLFYFNDCGKIFPADMDTEVIHGEQLRTYQARHQVMSTI